MREVLAFIVICVIILLYGSYVHHTATIKAVPDKIYIPYTVITHRFTGEKDYNFSKAYYQDSSSAAQSHKNLECIWEVYELEYKILKVNRLP